MIDLGGSWGALAFIGPSPEHSDIILAWFWLPLAWLDYFPLAFEFTERCQKNKLGNTFVNLLTMSLFCLWKSIVVVLAPGLVRLPPACPRVHEKVSSTMSRRRVCRRFKDVDFQSWEAELGLRITVS